jgi:hypothetical protein
MIKLSSILFILPHLGAWIAQSVSDSLPAGRPGIEYRWVARFPAPIQTGSVDHPASCTMGTGSFPGVNLPGRGVEHPPPGGGTTRNM